MVFVFVSNINLFLGNVQAYPDSARRVFRDTPVYGKKLGSKNISYFCITGNLNLLCDPDLRL